MNKLLNIAIDGPSSSGKSTIADIIGKRLNILHLDTGAMYRAVALKALSLNIDSLDENGVLGFIDNLNLDIVFENGKQKTMLDDKDVSVEIRRPEVSMMASNISSLKCVREKMVEMQQQIAKKISCVLDGRDIGTCVLPNSEYKFFMQAKSEVRAKRRFDELVEKGYNVVFEDILKDIETRDYNDKNRVHSPLKMAEGSIEIDTTEMTIEQVASLILSFIR